MGQPFGRNQCKKNAEWSETEKYAKNCDIFVKVSIKNSDIFPIFT